MNRNRILCAAIHYKNGSTYLHQPKNIKSGLVICGRRHHNAFTILSQIVSLPELKKFNVVQGFITSDDNFVDRKKAFTIAKSADQILFPKVQRDEEGVGLISEDLY